MIHGINLHIKMKGLIKNILRKGLLKESVKITNISDSDEYWDRVRLTCINDKGQEVGYAELDMWITESEWSYMSDDQEGKFSDDEFAEHFPEGGAAKLEKIKIKPEFRNDPNNRYGSELMKAVVDYCKSRDVKTMYLIASPMGDGPKIPLEKLGAFYAKHGFKVVKDFQNAYDMVAQLRERLSKRIKKEA